MFRPDLYDCDANKYSSNTVRIKTKLIRSIFISLIFFKRFCLCMELLTCKNNISPLKVIYNVYVRNKLQQLKKVKLWRPR